MMVRTNFLNNIILKNKNVKLARGAVINKQTEFGGHNYVGHYSRIDYSSVGYATYIGSQSNFSHCIIGKYCSIGSNVNVVDGFHPSRDWVSTHPAFYAIQNCTNLSYVSVNKFQELRYADGNSYCVVGNDVWIGNNAIILGGVTVGDGAIVGTGAVVTKDVSPYSIVAGVPAKEIRKRFSDDEIVELLSLQWWNKDPEWINKHAASFDNLTNLLSDLSN